MTFGFLPCRLSTGHHVLHAVELGVVAALDAQEFVVGAGFLDFAFVEDDDFVGLLDRAQAVGDDERGTALHQLFDRFLDELLGFGID